MATRQYIGARYVPKFYQNSVDGSTQWESNVVYEPLTYVTLQNGHMYISKKEVPATVGTPASNIDYWLDVGNYDGFIEQLQDEIDVINGTLTSLESNKQNKTDNTLDTTAKTVVGAINELNTDKQNKTDNSLDTTAKTVVGAINELSRNIGLNRKVICVGDSYLGGSGVPYAESNSWGAKLRELLNNGTDTIIKGYGGSGFIGQPTVSDHTYILQLQDAASNLSANEKDAITDIVAIGGLNDKYGLINGTYTATDISNAIYAFCNYAHATFPNAMIRIGVAGWATDGLTDKQYWATILNCFERCATGYAPNKVQYMAGLEYIMPTIKDSDYYDGIHPDVDASKLIAEGVLNCMMGGNGAIVKNYTNQAISLTYESGITETARNMKFDIYGNIATVKIETLWVSFDTAITYTYASEVLLGEISNGVPVRASLGIKIPATIWYNSDVVGEPNRVTDGYIKIMGKKVYVYINTDIAGATIKSLIIKCPYYSDSVFNIC